MAEESPRAATDEESEEEGEEAAEAAEAPEPESCKTEDAGPEDSTEESPAVPEVEAAAAPVQALPFRTARKPLLPTPSIFSPAITAYPALQRAYYPAARAYPSTTTPAYPSSPARAYPSTPAYPSSRNYPTSPTYPSTTTRAYSSARNYPSATARNYPSAAVRNYPSTTAPASSTTTAAAASAVVNTFANDGSFLELFKKKMEESPAGSKEEAASPEDKKPEPDKRTPISFVGKRRGGARLALKTGMVAKKPKTNEEEEVVVQKGGAWAQYMAEVKKYKAHQCSDDDKTRPLVK